MLHVHGVVDAIQVNIVSTFKKIQEQFCQKNNLDLEGNI